jgi:hypothetical protein
MMMRPTTILNNLCLATTLLLSQSVFAYDTEDKSKEPCKPPKMLEFTLPEYSKAEPHEVPPQSEFSFKLSGGTPAEKIRVIIKDKPLPVEITSNSSFTLIKGKIPAEYTGQYARLNVIVNTELGCISRDGWLVKIAAQ